MRHIATFIIAVMLAGCQLTREQAQQFSQALADIEAARLVAAAAGDHHVAGLCVAAAARVHAGLGRDAVKALPPPKMPAAVLSASHGAALAEQADAENAQANPPPGWGAWLWGAGSAVGLLALALGRKFAPMLPGVGPLWAGAADLAWEVVATKQQRAADRAAQQASKLVAALAPHAAIILQDPALSARLPDEVYKALAGITVTTPAKA